MRLFPRPFWAGVGSFAIIAVRSSGAPFVKLFPGLRAQGGSHVSGLRKISGRQMVLAGVIPLSWARLGFHRAAILVQAAGPRGPCSGCSSRTRPGTGPGSFSGPGQKVPQGFHPFGGRQGCKKGGSVVAQLTVGVSGTRHPLPLHSQVFPALVRSAPSGRVQFLTGNAPGCDQLMQTAAGNFGLPCMVWQPVSPTVQSLRVRTVAVVRACNFLLAFPRTMCYRQSGTWLAVNTALKSNIPVLVFASAGTPLASFPQFKSCAGWSVATRPSWLPFKGHWFLPSPAQLTLF